jgi:non-canonical purine NTP pyrophosphatase (RdgB/HAM1 family)
VCDLPEVRETGRAFEDNAVIKAIAISKVFPHEMVIADDSGLEVDALNGAPGVFSARYGGENASDQGNVEKLLREVQGATKRSARFPLRHRTGKKWEIAGNGRGRSSRDDHEISARRKWIRLRSDLHSRRI